MTARIKRGRPRKFETPGQMQESIGAYFSSCDETNKPYTVEGLCHVLEIDRKTLLNYEKETQYKEFFSVVKNAKIKIQQNLVERALLGENNSTITVFLLKANYGYEEKGQPSKKNETITVKFG